nr:KTSC domain-containing protein [uncultured Undibacterium sp.]
MTTVEQTEQAEQVKESPVIAITPVESSQLFGIGHCPVTNTLAIQFKAKADAEPNTGSIYHYDNFTSEQFSEFKSAESLGSHFKRLIKPAVEAHPYRKVA